MEDYELTQQIPPDVPVVVSAGKAVPDYRALLASAPFPSEVLARPDAYEAWYKRAQEAING